MNLRNKLAFSILLLLLLASTITLVFNVEIVKASGTIYIRANGLVEGTDKIVSVDNVTYTLTDNISNAIQIERNNIVFDGAGYTVQGTEEVQVGVELYFTSNVTLKDTQIKGFWIGIHLATCANITISGNNITNNWATGIELGYYTNNTVICRNNILESGSNGIVFQNLCFGNKLYHNNFINNTSQVYVGIEANFWDDGYPSGGNYWSDYDGADADQDGIGDMPYVIRDENVQDEYPLMGPISFFDAGTWDEIAYCAHTVSNSTVSDFHFSESEKLIGFNVTGLDDTIGFCRVAIPNDVLWCDNPEQWQLWINNTLKEDRDVLEDDSYVYIYFTYNQSTQNVEVKGIQAIPEGSNFGVVVLLSSVAIFASFYCLRKRPKLKAVV